MAVKLFVARNPDWNPSNSHETVAIDTVTGLPTLYQSRVKCFKALKGTYSTTDVRKYIQNKELLFNRYRIIHLADYDGKVTPIPYNPNLIPITT